MGRCVILVLAVLHVLVLYGSSSLVSVGHVVAQGFQPDPEDVVTPPGLPALDKWMLDPQLQPAHWLGESYQGKSLQEPINIILLDYGASSAEDAKSRLVAAATAAGYPSRWGHSSGYHGFIGGQLYDQLPEENYHAFSNQPFFRSHNHGRIFGPAPYEGGYLFTASFSREKFEPLAEVRHQYVSFNQARDDFAQQLMTATPYRIRSFVNMENALIDHPDLTTGDHDGIAVLLTREDRGTETVMATATVTVTPTGTPVQAATYSVYLPLLAKQTQAGW